MSLTMLEQTNFEKTKQLVLDKLQERKVPIDGWVHNLMNKIEKASSMVIYCPSCKDLGYISFVPHDGFVMANCDTCGQIFNHLEDMERGGLYSIVHYNIMMHQKELRQ